MLKGSLCKAALSLSSSLPLKPFLLICNILSLFLSTIHKSTVGESNLADLLSQVNPNFLQTTQPLSSETKTRISATAAQMPADSGNSKPAKFCHTDSGQSASGAPPPEQQEQLPCPRCNSTNTKFCYYNNYNFSQPRHFCKGCRRYWTQGGTLRDIPVGGGSRKNAKRSRTSSGCSTPIGSPALPSLVTGHDGSVTSRAVHYPTASVQSGFAGGELQKQGINVCSSFTSLLNAPGPGFLALGGFGLGPGLEEMAAFGLGRGVWAFPGAGDGGGGNGGGMGMMNAWQLEGSGFGGGDCFGWPDLAISTPGGNELK